MSKSKHYKVTKTEYDYDVIVIGAGAAGLFTALHVPSTLQVLVVSKSNLLECNSQLAQGGIAAALEQEDEVVHIEDTLRVGCYRNDVSAVEMMVRESHEVIETLIHLGMNFDREQSGELHATREGGHTNSRIVHHADNTGAEVMRTLSAAVHGRTNITVLENTFVYDLLMIENRCCGILYCSSNDTVAVATAPQVVLATGGIGELYLNTTNSKIATGDGVAMAFRAGAKIADMEFVQFHPTAFFDEKDDRRFLISEAVRGEGAYLRNEKGQRFMAAFLPLMELSARDIVAREIYYQIEHSQKPWVYLDLTHLDAQYMIKRFPNIYAKCLQVGIDFTRDLIPVSPVQHYIMGGVWTDMQGQTSIEGLFACGEVASTGVHGANRLASNSLLEALVFGRQIGSNCISRTDATALGPVDLEVKSATEPLSVEKKTIQAIISDCASIFRSQSRLQKGQDQLELWEERVKEASSLNTHDYEILNMIQVGLLIVHAAQMRKVSLGAHKRLDSEVTQ